MFYDAAEGQARVLGGGVIAGTMAAVPVKDALGADLAARALTRRDDRRAR